MITSENFAMLRKTETANSPEKNAPDSFYAKEKCRIPAYYQDSSILCLSFKKASLYCIFFYSFGFLFYHFIFYRIQYFRTQARNASKSAASGCVLAFSKFSNIMVRFSEGSIAS